MTIFGVNVLDTMPPTGPVRIWDAAVQWCDLERTQGNWDWSRLDAMVNAAGKRSIMIVLGHPPAWAAKGGPDGKQAAWMPAGSNRPPLNMTVWRNYVRKVVTRYKGRVNCYQVWNEPADKRFYSGTWEELGELTKAAHNVVKSVDSNALVISPPLQPRRQAGWIKRGPLIIKAMKDNGYPFDWWSCHIYPQVGEGIDGFARDAKLVIDAVKSLPKNNLWITETNYNLGGTGNPYSLDKQETLKKRTKEVCERLDIERVYWYAYAYNNPSLIAIDKF